jgi:hypothetical protein
MSCVSLLHGSVTDYGVGKGYMKENVLKILIEIYGNKYVIETHADQNLEGVKQIFRSIMTMMTFYPSQFDDVIVSDDNNEQEIERSNNV